MFHMLIYQRHVSVLKSYYYFFNINSKYLIFCMNIFNNLVCELKKISWKNEFFIFFKEFLKKSLTQLPRIKFTCFVLKCTLLNLNVCTIANGLKCKCFTLRTKIKLLESSLK